MISLNEIAITSGIVLLCYLIFLIRKWIRLETLQSASDNDERFKNLLNFTPDPLVIANEDGMITLINLEFEREFGYTEKEIIGKSIEVLLPETYREHHVKIRNEYFSRPELKSIGSRKSLEAVRKDGTVFHAEIGLNPVESKSGRYTIAAVRNVDNNKVSKDELERLATFPLLSPIPIIEVKKNGGLTFCNPVARRLFPNLEKQEFAHPLLVGLEKQIDELDSESCSMVRHANVEGLIYEQRVTYFPDTQVIRIYAWDITDLQEMTLQMAYQANHDSLTGLLNRVAFEKRLREAASSAISDKKEHALCYIDLDQFKIVNDTCGHVVGDELLKKLTHMLQKTLRDSDCFARLGGDEFGLLLVGCPMERAVQIANNFRQKVADFRFSWKEHSFNVGASIGLVGITKENSNVTNLLSFADAACYMAKEHGRNRVYVYEPDDEVLEQHTKDMNWTHRIRRALDEDRLVLYSQVIRPLESGDDHYEILLRLLDEEGHIVAPMNFLPAAERYNLMPEIDCWVVKNTMSLMLDGVFKDSDCSINLSGQSLGDPHVMNFLTSEILGSNVDPTRICFEVTETAMITNFSSAKDFMDTLRNIGCKFALDDFGSGLSSFGYLKDLPVDYLKIDGRFVKDILSDQISQAMVASINHVGHVMNLQTIAEFVEDEETMMFLREIGVDYAQGYGIEKPIPVVHVESELKKTSTVI